MAFSYKNKKGDTYYLHARRTPSTTGGKERVLYFFAREQKAGVLNEVPQGYQVAETQTGLPVLKKK